MVGWWVFGGRDGWVDEEGRKERKKEKRKKEKRKQGKKDFSWCIIKIGSQRKA